MTDASKPSEQEREANGKALFIACCLARGRSQENAEFDWQNWEGDFMSQEQWCQVAETFSARAAQPAAQEDARDGARYRWLRDKAMGDEGMPFICVLTNGYTGQLDGIAADEAIDAAMSAKEAGE